MNSDYQTIKQILLEIKKEYELCSQINEISKDVPITERDIVAEIYSRLKQAFKGTSLSVHCEIKPALSDEVSRVDLHGLNRIDVGMLTDIAGKSWRSSALKLQNQYLKGSIESRFSSIPVEFFHTAIEVKIQSNVSNAIDDLNTLEALRILNSNCNCFFLLLNARGRRADHNKIVEYAKQKGVLAIEYTCR